MNKTKTALLAAVVALVVAGLVSVLTPSPEKVVERVVERLGAVSGPEISGNTFSVGGVSRQTDRVGMKNATSTLCVIRTPSATSTLERFTANITTSTSTAVQGVLATSTIAYNRPLAQATSSLMATGIIPADTTDYFIYRPATLSQTGAAATYLGVNATNTQSVIGPNLYLLYTAQGGTVLGTDAGVGTVWAGTCTATFETLN